MLQELTKTDEHHCTLARLDWELEQRKRFTHFTHSSYIWDCVVTLVAGRLVRPLRVTCRCSNVHVQSDILDSVLVSEFKTRARLGLFLKPRQYHLPYFCLALPGCERASSWLGQSL